MGGWAFCRGYEHEMMQKVDFLTKKQQKTEISAMISPRNVSFEGFLRLRRKMPKFGKNGGAGLIFLMPI